MALALLPAAGASRRMGRPKLLLPWHGRTLVGVLVASLREAGVDPIVLVTSPDNTDLQRWAFEAGIETACNPEPAGGMLTTIWRGLDRLEELGVLEGAGGPLLILPADLPLLASSTVRAVIDASEKHPGSLVMPTTAGQNGHPLAVPLTLVGSIRTLDAAVGLKQIRELHPLVTIEVDDPGVATDIDTPEDYERLGAAKPPP